MPDHNLILALLPVDLGTHAATLQSRRRITSSHETVQGVLTGLRESRTARGASRGTLRDTDKDLLRAALTFAGAGVDATLKQLLRDALPLLTPSHPKSAGAVKAFAKHLFDEEPKAAMRVLTAADPTVTLREAFIEFKTKGSLQGTDDLKQARDALGLPRADALADVRIDALADAFTARNQIIHELDLKIPSGRGDWAKRTRKIGTTVSQIDQIFEVTTAMVLETDRLLQSL